MDEGPADWLLSLVPPFTGTEEPLPHLVQPVDPPHPLTHLYLPSSGNARVPPTMQTPGYQDLHGLASHDGFEVSLPWLRDADERRVQVHEGGMHIMFANLQLRYAFQVSRPARDTTLFRCTLVSVFPPNPKGENHGPRRPRRFSG